MGLVCTKVRSGVAAGGVQSKGNAVRIPDEAVLAAALPNGQVREKTCSVLYFVGTRDDGHEGRRTIYHRTTPKVTVHLSCSPVPRVDYRSYRPSTSQPLGKCLTQSLLRS